MTTASQEGDDISLPVFCREVQGFFAYLLTCARHGNAQQTTPKLNDQKDKVSSHVLAACRPARIRRLHQPLCSRSAAHGDQNVRSGAIVWRTCPAIPPRDPSFPFVLQGFSPARLPVLRAECMSACRPKSRTGSPRASERSIPIPWRSDAHARRTGERVSGAWLGSGLGLGSG